MFTRLPQRGRSVQWLAFAALGLTVALAGCAKKEAAGRGGRGGAAPVLVAKAERKVVPLVLDAIGVVEPSATASLRSQVTGTLIKIHFREGQEVQQGDLLFEIDSRPFRNTLASAEADLQRITVQLGTARAQVERYRALTSGSLISPEQFQAISDTAAGLQAQLAASEAAVANAKLQLDYCLIRAPLAGRTGNLGAHEGDLVRASDANVALVVIHRLSPIYVTFGVPQQNLAALARYQAAGPIAVAATPAGDDQRPEIGQLIFVDNAVDATTGTIKLKATFANEAHRLWPGQFASVLITLDSPEVLTVPTPAVQNDQQGQHVFVVGADQIAELRDITVVRSHQGDSVVAKGLTAGETVVLDGQLRVVPGKPVEVKAAPAGGDTPKAKGKGKGKPKTGDQPKAP